jgi:hypothetical protein
MPAEGEGELFQRQLPQVVRAIAESEHGTMLVIVDMSVKRENDVRHKGLRGGRGRRRG